MNSIRSGRLRRPAAERLLDGGPAGRRGGAGQQADPLAGLLAAAAAAPHPGEQAGEDVAVTAFRAEHLVPASHSGRGQMIKSPLAKLLTMKAGALALALSAGGVAVAATTGAFSPAAAPAPAGAHQPVTAHMAGGSQGGGAHAAVRSSAAGTHAGGSAARSLPVSALSAADAVQACHELASQVSVARADAAAVSILTETGLQNAFQSPALSWVVDNPEFDALVATAESRTDVADYCGLILHLAKLASPATLANLPASVLTGIPVATVAQIPASALSGVPAASLAKLPTAFLSRLSGSALAALPASVLAKLPASVLSRLPASVLKGLLPSLPAGTLGQLPSKLLAGAMSGLPASSLTSVAAELSGGTRVKTLSLLPTDVLAKLPASLLSGLPGSLLSKLGSSL
jgi:hypothetical protein